MTKYLVTNSANNFTSLELDWASRNNCRQRSGRAGRVMHGRCYRMIPKRMFNVIWIMIRRNFSARWLIFDLKSISVLLARVSSARNIAFATWNSCVESKDSGNGAAAFDFIDGNGSTKAWRYRKHSFGAKRIGRNVGNRQWYSIANRWRYHVHWTNYVKFTDWCTRISADCTRLLLQRAGRRRYYG